MLPLVQWTGSIRKRSLRDGYDMMLVDYIKPSVSSKVRTRLLRHCMTCMTCTWRLVAVQPHGILIEFCRPSAMPGRVREFASPAKLSSLMRLVDWVF